jgi:pimeloyl-ACP methyl ester carboxylesterase
VAISAAALLAAALTGCGVGKATDDETISETTTTYLRALAAGDTATACTQLTPDGRGTSCAPAMKARLSPLDPAALRRAADASMDIDVHGTTATAALAEPHDARLTLVKRRGAWRIATGYTVPPARPRRAAPGIIGGGRLVGLGGARSLYLDCVGSGTPTIVLEAGLGGDSGTWRDVQARLGHVTRTCAYDRAGLGNSLPMPGVHDAADEIKDLQRLLHHAALAPPYLLVGHSYGGLLVRLFARAHPDKTAGVVLVDARGRHATRRQLAIWPKSQAPGVRRAVLRPVQDGVDLASSEALAGRIRSLANTPLAVVTAAKHNQEWGHLVPPRLARAMDRLWATMQDELAALSSDHIHVVALRSDHFIQRVDGQPDVVIHAVRAVVRAARGHTDLPSCRRLFSGPGVQCRD